jgi:Type IV secretion-system coupling protein DNA-binding domain
MIEEKSVAELLTEQFYTWEGRGRGQFVAESRVDLEPPFRPFRGHSLPQSRFVDDGVQESGLSRLTGSLLSLFGKSAEPPQVEDAEDESEPEVEPAPAREDLLELQVALPKEYRPLPEVFEQCLFALRYCRSALSFEIIGDKTELVAQMTAERRDAEQLFAQLKAHFPEAVITPVQQFLENKWRTVGQDVSEICEFGLVHEFMLPLQLASNMATDPLVAICGALEYLGEQELGVFQVLFRPVRERWAESILKAVTTEDGEPFFENAPEILAQTKKKLSRPLFAVLVRAAAQSPEEDRVWHVIKSIAGALSLFENPAGNRLGALTNESYSEADHEEDLLARSSHRFGMILNSDELISLAHLPSVAVRSRKLKRETKRTKSAPAIATGEGVVLGENAHEGQIVQVTLKPEQRMRHMHVIGASGTGKSTLLLNLICQDIYQGRGVGVLDPHGDLIDQILGYVPPERYKDVILFDASDSEYPVGFNILSAHSELEKTLLASDLVSVFQRLSTAWGDQMTSVLGNAILAFLESTTGGTLADLRRFLIERPYRDEFLQTVKDPEVVYYWEQQFPLLKSNSLGPLLTRLDTFLRPKTIRYMVAQKETKLDFASIMNDGKIFLAKLPQGIIGEENAFLLGTLLVSKLHQLTISRQEMEAALRRPFFLYLDEFQHFATPTMATILSGVRKYQLALVLAHHEIAQLQKSGELASAVLSQPYTRVCFRVGSEDARRLAEGFSFFEPKDFQNLGTGEAICRVERSDFDFNLRTIRPPELDEAAVERRAYIRYLTRVQYGTPWQKVEEELAKSRFRSKADRVDPFGKRMAKEKAKTEEKEDQAKVEPEEPPSQPVPEKPKPVDVPPPPRPKPSAPPPSEIEKPKGETAQAPAVTLPPPALRPGRGGEEHQFKQQKIKELAATLGYVIDVEKAISGGSVDVALVRGKMRIACEISVSTSPRHELENVSQRFEAGFNLAIVVAGQKEHARKLKEAAEKILKPEERAKVMFCTMEEVGEVLVDIAAKTPISETVTHGRKVTVKHDPRAAARGGDAKKTMLDTVAKLIRLKRGGKSSGSD